MSQENVELVRAGFAAYNNGDLDAMLETYDPEVEFVTLLLGNRHGKEALRVLFEENREAVLGYRLDPEELIDAGPDKVIAVAHLGGAGRVSQIALGDLIAFLFTIKDGLIVRQQTFRNKEEALEAAVRSG
jgi:ketosteroid isomerase-like protein